MGLIFSLFDITSAQLNSHLKWSDHVKHITAKASHSLNYLRHTLFASPPTVKSAAYNCLVRPLLEYVSPVWYLHTARDIDRLEAIQRRAARWVCGSRWNPHSHNWSKSRDPPIMLIILPIMLCCTAQKFTYYV